MDVIKKMVVFLLGIIKTQSIIQSFQNLIHI